MDLHTMLGRPLATVATQSRTQPHNQPNSCESDGLALLTENKNAVLIKEPLRGSGVSAILPRPECACVDQWGTDQKQYPWQGVLTVSWSMFMSTPDTCEAVV